MYTISLRVGEIQGPFLSYEAEIAPVKGDLIQLEDERLFRVTERRLSASDPKAVSLHGYFVNPS